MIIGLTFNYKVHQRLFPTCMCLSLVLQKFLPLKLYLWLVCPVPVLNTFIKISEPPSLSDLEEVVIGHKQHGVFYVNRSKSMLKQAGPSEGVWVVNQTSQGKGQIRLR